MYGESASTAASELVMAEADRAWWRRSRDEIVVNADLVDRGGRGLDALGGQGSV